MESVYVESSVISYLASDPSRDLIVAAHQAVGRQWWDTARSSYQLYISHAVLDEIEIGDAEQVRKRRAIIQGLGVLDYNQHVHELIDYYSQKLGLTGSAVGDVPHFAFAVSAAVNFLVTWNCKHIANAVVMRRLRKLNDAIGRKTPIICTPDVLLAAEDGEIR